MPSETAVTASPPETAVVRGKLRAPSLPERRVVRPRLEERLADLIERHRVVAVSATAGAGKSTAVTAALRLLNRPVAWLAVDRTEEAAGRLLTYLEAAVAEQIPHVTGVVAQALSAGIKHPETAGLLAEAAGDEGIVVVLDDLERLHETGDAWAVIEAFLRYAPAGMRAVLISRRAMPDALSGLALTEGALAEIGETELAFTPDEAAEALSQRGDAGVDANAAIAATGGWVTGVLFEAWRSAGHASGGGGEADPLHGYLAAHILGQLVPEDRDFLITTSLLDDVDAPRAAALGRTDAGERLASLRRSHLPVSWRADGRALRCHPRFREYLLHRLERLDAAEQRALRLANGRLLAEEQHYEDATEELLRAHAPELALRTAELAIVPTIERHDFALAERWLRALGDAQPETSPTLVAAELMLAYAQEDFKRGERVADGLAALGDRERIARSSDTAAALMAMCYVHAGRFDDVDAVLAIAGDGPNAQIARYAIAPTRAGPSPPRPKPSGGPLDALAVSVDYVHGYLADIANEPLSGWVDAVAQPWRIAALAASGHTERALELYDEVRRRGIESTVLDTIVGPEILIDAGRRDDALAAIARGRTLARKSHSRALEVTADLEEANVALRLDHDPAAALAVLARLESEPDGRAFATLNDWTDALYGCALLGQSDDDAARERLRPAVERMIAGDRLLNVPMAAVYLAEAEWRAGDEDGADRAADLALEASRRHGSNHILLRALAQFPAVVSRRIDAEPEADSAWHDLGRALIAQGVRLPAAIPGSVELQEFGRSAIVVNGEPARPRIAKTYELLAYLTTRPNEQADRDELLEALFDGRTDDSTRAYLRQAIRWLRHVLPGDGALVTESARVRIDDSVVVVTESTRFESRLAEAAAMQGADRLAATLDALAIADGGEYLRGARSRWADERRGHLAELATDARYEAAELAFEGGRYDDALRLSKQVLEADPFREAAWRLTMHVAGALGDVDGVIRAYQRCEDALAKIGTTPAPTTRQLLERLRR